MQEQRETTKFVSRELSERRVSNNAQPQQQARALLPAVRKHSGPSSANGRHRTARTGEVRRKRWSGLQIKMVVCTAVAVACLLVRFVPGTFAQNARQTLTQLFTYDLDLDETLGRLKFVENLFPGAAAVFGTQSQRCYPVEGDLLRSFGQDNLPNIAFQAMAGAKVVAIDAGRVTKRGVSEQYGNYLRIEHTDGLETYYYGLAKSSLDKGAEVQKGQEIGTLGEDGVLVFALHASGAARNPLSYLGAQ